MYSLLPSTMILPLNLVAYHPCFALLFWHMVCLSEVCALLQPLAMFVFSWLQAAAYHLILYMNSWDLYGYLWSHPRNSILQILSVDHALFQCYRGVNFIFMLSKRHNHKPQKFMKLNTKKLKWTSYPTLGQWRF